LAKLKGARVVGIAGGAEKCRHAVEVLGFDACLDHREPALKERLAAACPDGIDVYFENVGGDVLDAVLPLLNLHARVPVCGFIAHYNEEGGARGSDKRTQLLATILARRVRMQGFIILDHYADRYDAFRRDMSQWIAQGRVRLQEDIVDGLEQAPAALIGLLQGRNFGKVVVRVADE
jgi:NADPH-dependent curcumin reductase CurA